MTNFFSSFYQRATYDPNEDNNLDDIDLNDDISVCSTSSEEVIVFSNSVVTSTIADNSVNDEGKTGKTTPIKDFFDNIGNAFVELGDKIKDFFVKSETKIDMQTAEKIASQDFAEQKFGSDEEVEITFEDAIKPPALENFKLIGTNL